MQTAGDSRRNIQPTDRQSSETLSRCLRLLTQRTPLADWPEEVRQPFLAACFAPSGDRAEAEKAKMLRWYLFPSEVPAPSGLAADAAAERLRADLVGTVAEGAGAHLLPELRTRQAQRPTASR